ncbi:MAG TPA: PASTA domain-containing protein [Chryseolinea sp.]|nr:PASTA domain-containing protein [Chryseolinea sp.]HPH46052.1 PASTA domain-containing protein [Chryseolinea sp.]HPM29725.1 PASTA domain-containing protein [Chryseolinea sp.]
MKLKFESNTLKGLLINVSLVIGLLILLSFTFFYKVLPNVTNKDKVVTVPDLNGMSFEEAKKFLETRELNYEVTDSAFDSEMKPLTVLEQFPKPLSKVKIQRKINLTLNARNAPLVNIPDFTGSTLDFAQRQLATLDIKVAGIKYRPDIAPGSILEIVSNGKKVQVGQRLPKGSKVDLIVGSFTDKPFPLPDFIGMDYDDVEVLVFGMNLKIGETHIVIDDKIGQGIIQKQYPLSGDSVKTFDKIDLWVYNFERE